MDLQYRKKGIVSNRCGGIKPIYRSKIITGILESICYLNGNFHYIKNKLQIEEIVLRKNNSIIGFDAGSLYEIMVIAELTGSDILVI